MSRYNLYWDRQMVSQSLHERLLAIGEQAAPSARASVLWRRWGALAACCALVLGLGLSRLAAPASAGTGEPVPSGGSGGGTSASASGEALPGDGSSGGAASNRFLVEGPGQEEMLSLPAIPYINYQSVDGRPEADGAFSRDSLAGSFSVDLTKEDVQKIFWGAEGKPEGAEGDLPWMLFWEGFLLSGSALYDGEGDLLWVTLTGEQAEQGVFFTLTLRPGELPFQCGLYSGLETTDVCGVPVTGWSRTGDIDGDGADDVQCVSEFMAGEIGVRFSVECAAGENPMDSAVWYSSLLVRQVLSADGGVYLDDLLTNENIPAWREAGFSSLEEARQETAFAPYLPEENIPGYGAFCGTLSYQEGVQNRLSVHWYRGYDDVSITVCLPEGELDWALADPARPEQYDLRLYSIPWSESVPEEYRDTVNFPTFRESDMSLAVVEARGSEKDTGGESFRFGVLWDTGVLVEYRCDGLTARRVWELVQETGPEEGEQSW